MKCFNTIFVAAYFSKALNSLKHIKYMCELLLMLVSFFSATVVCFHNTI